MKNHRNTLVLCLLFTCFLLSQGVFTALAAPPVPFRIGGELTDDGERVPEKAAEYTFTVTRLDNTPYTPLAADDDGLNSFGWYEINIPIYDASAQPGGATPGSQGKIHVYKEGKEMKVLSPANGVIDIGSAGGIAQINVSVTSSGSIALMMSSILSSIEK